jgi:DNA-binding MarR family transcriptional regulator
MAPRMTLQTIFVLQALLRNPSREMYGLEVSAETGLLPGTAYPILNRLENEGWVTSRWEDIDPHAEKRPARRYYRLAADGAQRASAACAAARLPTRAALRGLAGEAGGAPEQQRPGGAPWATAARTTSRP